MIPIYKAFLNPYKKSAYKAIESEWISNHGIYVDLATEKLKGILDISYCILMNNGTSSTHCLVKSLKFKYPNIKKIYVPNNCFIAPYNCILQEFPESIVEVLEIDPETLNMRVDEEYVKSLEINSAILIVHNLGGIVNVPRLKRLRPDIIFMEDNCEGLFGKYEGIYSGTSSSSLCSAVSFYGNKTITTGEGGAFFTHDLNLYKYIKTYYSHGMSETRYIHNIQGTNYRMTNIQAALLWDQLNDLQNILDKKKQIFINYIDLFSDLVKEGKIKLIKNEKETIHSNWMFAILFSGYEYSNLESYLLEKGIQIRPLFYDFRKHEHLKNIKCNQEPIGNIGNAESGCMLPSYPELNRDEQEYIRNCIKEFLIVKT